MIQYCLDHKQNNYAFPNVNLTQTESLMNIFITYCRISAISAMIAGSGQRLDSEHGSQFRHLRIPGTGYATPSGSSQHKWHQIPNPIREVWAMCELCTRTGWFRNAVWECRQTIGGTTNAAPPIRLYNQKVCRAVTPNVRGWPMLKPSRARPPRSRSKASSGLVSNTLLT